MSRRWRGSSPSLAFLVLTAMVASVAEAAVFAPSAAPSEPTLAPPEFQPDPVMSSIDVIGRPSALPRVSEIPDITLAQSMSGGDASAEAIFPGGTASTIGGVRFIEGVSDARDPMQLLPPEPSVALRVPIPSAAGLLVAGTLSLALLRRRLRGRAAPA